MINGIVFYPYVCRAQRDDDDDVSVGRPSLSVDMYEVEFLLGLVKIDDKIHVWVLLCQRQVHL